MRFYNVNKMKFVIILGVLLLMQQIACNTREHKLKVKHKAHHNNKNKQHHSKSHKSLRVPSNGYKIVCYYTNWAQYRDPPGRFVPEDIQSDLCTHIIFSFATLRDGQLASSEWNDESSGSNPGMYERIQNLKQSNPALKTLLALGGGAFGSSQFSSLVASPDARQNFIQTAIPYLRRWGFNGLDIDWEFPDGDQDKQNFVTFLRELRQAFNQEATSDKLILTIAVSAGEYMVNRGYDVPDLAAQVDFINVMTYDFHGPWDGSKVGHNAPLYPASSDTPDERKLCVSYGSELWANLGAPREKLIIGMPSYGRTFTLSDPNQNTPNSPSSGTGRAGPITKTPGVLAYYEVCNVLQNQQARYVWDTSMQVPYALQGDQWIGFDDVASIKNKMQFIKERGFGGAMVWTLDLDDFSGTQCWSNIKFPLIRTMRDELRP